MKMSEKSIAVLIVLAFIGIGMAFAYIGMMISVKKPSEVEGITGQNETNEQPELTVVPSKPEGPIIWGKNETDEMPELTEEQKEKAKKIALSDSRVQKRIGGKEYKIRLIQAHTLITQTGEHELRDAAVFIDLPGINKWFDVRVDLEEGKVTHIGPLLPIPAPPEEQ